MMLISRWLVMHVGDVTNSKSFMFAGQKIIFDRITLVKRFRIQVADEIENRNNKSNQA